MMANGINQRPWVLTANKEVPRRLPKKCRFTDTVVREHTLLGSAVHLATLPLRRGSG